MWSTLNAIASQAKEQASAFNLDALQGEEGSSNQSIPTTPPTPKTPTAALPDDDELFRDDDDDEGGEVDVEVDVEVVEVEVSDSNPTQNELGVSVYTTAITAPA